MNEILRIEAPSIKTALNSKLSLQPRSDAN